MEKYITDEKTGLKYELVGDCYYPRLASSSGLLFLLFPKVKPPLWFTSLYTTPEVYTIFGTDSLPPLI